MRAVIKTLLPLLLLLAGLSLTSPAGEGPQPEETEPQVISLLKLRAKDDFLTDGKYHSAFFKTLIKLAEKQGLKAEDYLRYQVGTASSILTDGAAIEIESTRKRYVVVLLTAPCLSRPGTAVQQLVLLNRQGSFLDKLACHINSRYGDLRTEITKGPETDGAQLVIRFRPDPMNKSQWHHWHTITYGGKAYTSNVPEQQPQPSDWITKGLCRIAIREGKFVVLFPRPEKPATTKDNKGDATD